MSGRPPAGRVARAAARYRPGKAPVAGAGALSSGDESEDDDGQSKVQDEMLTSIDSRGAGGARKGTLPQQQRRTAGVVIQTGDSKINLDLSSVQVGKKEPEPQSSEYETDTDESDAAPPKPVFRKPGSQPSAPDAKESSSEYETDSEEEEEVKPMLKPVFVPKRQRGTIAERDIAALAAQDAETQAQTEAEARRREAHLLAAESIKRALAEKEHEESKPDLDDTDGKDPEAEFAAWRIRELSRIQRDRSAAAELEREKEEVLRRREMPQDVRDREDTERAKKQRIEAKANKGKPGFLQKYYHKGAFFQDMEILKKHDFQQATESAVDKTNLPAIMQVRDFGKRSRSKYTHLAAEDTTRQDNNKDFGFGSTSKQGCFRCGGPHLARDCSEPDTRFQKDGGPRRDDAGYSRDGIASSERPKDSGWGSRPRERDTAERGPRRDDERQKSSRSYRDSRDDGGKRYSKEDRDPPRRDEERRKGDEPLRGHPRRDGERERGDGAREWKGMYGGYGKSDKEKREGGEKR